MSQLYPMRFRAVAKVPPEASREKKKETRDDNRKKTLENLVKQLPAEATGVYLLGLDLFADRATLLTMAMLVGAAVLVLVRFVLKASWWVIITSLISYALWVYAMGNGPFQLIFEHFEITDPPGVGTFFISVWTTVITILANYGYIK